LFAVQEANRVSNLAAITENMDTQATNGVLEEFRLEFSQFWPRIPNKLAFFGLLAAWVLLFHFLGSSTLGYVNTPSLFGYLYDAYSSGGQSLATSEEGYAVLVPAVVLFLIWIRRRELVALDLRSWWPGLLLLATGLLLHLFGYAVQQPRISVVGFFVGLYGLTGLAWGPAWLRATFFPFFLFGFCVPIGSLAEPITFRLRLLVSQLVGFVSHYLLAIDVKVQGNLLVDPSGHYQYEIAAACSGIRSLIATVAFSIVLGFTSFKEFWKRTIIIASSVPFAVLGNLVRMLFIVIAAEMGGQEWGAYIHEGGPGGLFSLLPYIPAFVGLLALERYLRTPPSPSQLPQLNPLKLKRT
jgi:exosortase